MRNLLPLVILIAACSDGIPPHGDKFGPYDLSVPTTCSSAGTICNSCPESLPPPGEFVCTAAWNCHMNTTEWSIDCRCDASGRGRCCGSDSLDACPSDIPANGASCCAPKGGWCYFDEVGDAGFGKTVQCTCSDGAWVCS